MLLLIYIFLAFIIIARALFKTKTFIVNIKRKIYVLMKIKGYGKSQLRITLRRVVAPYYQRRHNSTQQSLTAILIPGSLQEPALV